MTCTAQWILSTLIGLAGVAMMVIVCIFAVAVYVRASEWIDFHRRWPLASDPFYVVGACLVGLAAVGMVVGAATVAHDAVYGCPSCRPAWMGGCEGTTSSSEGAE